MGDPAAATWISLAAFGLSAIVALFAYLRKNPFVAMSVAEELRREITDLRSRLQALVSEVTALRTQLNITIVEREWWREEYRKLKSDTDGTR
jgi:hypothetical protein